MENQNNAENSTVDTKEEISEAAQPVEEAAESEAAQTEGEELTEEEKQAAAIAKTNKIKIGIIAVGLAFILIAAIYAAAVAGGRTHNIPVAIPDDEIMVEPEITKEAKPTVAIAVEVEEEEPAPESLLAIMLGNRRYDECIYADGGVVIVRKGELFGAMDYQGKEIAPVKYGEIIQRPTEGGKFILGNSSVETVTEEKDGATLSYEKTVTKSTLFDNAGAKIYDGVDQVYTSDSVYMLGIEDSSDSRNNRIEYYRYDGKNKAFMVIYVKDSFDLAGFKDGKTIVYGFTAVPTEDQDTNPTNLVCGIMDERGKVTWYPTAPGIKEFSAEVEQWKEENKTIKTTSTKKKKAKMITTFDEDGNEIEISEDELDIDSDDEDTDDEEDELSDEDLEDIELTDEEIEAIEEEVDLSSGPQFHMDGILCAPSQGYFVVKDIYDVNDPYSFYDTKGNWLSDLDTSYMKYDSKKGFVTGNFNNGSVSVSKYVSGGQLLYNYGTIMVLNIEGRDVLVDVSKAKGMKSDSLENRIVLGAYDNVVISDSDFWMYRDGEKCGYIDHNGNKLKFSYDDATSFVDGHAMVVKDGKAFIIDEEFNQIEEIGDASGVDIAGDLMMVLNDGVTRNYILKENRDNPLGKKEE